jgi:GxxExxY protein
MRTRLFIAFVSLLNIKQQCPLNVFDEDGALLGEYFVDLLVNELLVVELKTAKTIAREHEAQLLAYLKGTHLRHGLLINFGSAKFEIRKFAL